MPRSKLNLLARYQAEVDASHIRYNALQVEVLACLEQTYTSYKGFRLPWQVSSKSVYIYGSVGSGKTYLMDLFYQSLPSSKKWRIHFHDLMNYIHEELKAFQGQVNPMQALVKQLATRYQVICIDELLVEDVVDAMLFVELLPALMAKGLMLVFTSNTKPSNLYLKGLQRQRFLTVIQLLETKAKVLSLNVLKDYRQLRLPLPQRVYWSPLSEQHQKEFKHLYQSYLKHLGEVSSNQNRLMVQGRVLDYFARSQSMIWFSFKQIASIPRCQRDYLELVKTYKVFFVSDLPQFQAQDVSSLVLWIYFIDVLYNAKAKLVVVAEVALAELYPDGPMLASFKRTLSRMQEMQSQWYWEGDS